MRFFIIYRTLRGFRETVPRCQQRSEHAAQFSPGQGPSTPGPPVAFQLAMRERTANQQR